MEDKTTGILIITPFFSPNIGGVETHLDDLVLELDRQGYLIFVQTYSPITSPTADWSSKEKRGKNIFITRNRWFGKNLFHKLEKFPALDFLYLSPYLFFNSMIFMALNRQKINVIHAQGLNAGLIGILLKKFFRKKLIISLHAIYELNMGLITKKTISWILKNADVVLGMSQAVLKQFTKLKINPSTLQEYRYWINTEKFQPSDNFSAREQVGLKNQFTVLFVGRLLKKKGVILLAEVAAKLPEIQFVFIGSGPESLFLHSTAKNFSNIFFLGSIDNSNLPLYYNCADLLCLPSLYQEGLGRVGMEAVACGIPVIGSNMGGIKEALDNTVSILVEPKIQNFIFCIKRMKDDIKKLSEMKARCRAYALQNFSKKNASYIIKHY